MADGWPSMPRLAAARGIYVAPVDGGPVKRLTAGTFTAIDPEWSRDGRWIYYSLDRVRPFHDLEDGG